MTTERKVIRAKVGLLELAKQLGNVSQACKIMGYSRDSFYRFQELYDKGILLSIDQYSPRQFNKMDVVISSDVAGVFDFELYSSIVGPSTLLAESSVRMEDLLQAKYEKKPSLALFGGRVKVNFELFLFQINKKLVPLSLSYHLADFALLQVLRLMGLY